MITSLVQAKVVLWPVKNHAAKALPAAFAPAGMLCFDKKNLELLRSFTDTWELNGTYYWCKQTPDSHLKMSAWHREHVKVPEIWLNQKTKICKLEIFTSSCAHWDAEYAVGAEAKIYSAGHVNWEGAPELNTAFGAFASSIALSLAKETTPLVLDERPVLLDCDGQTYFPSLDGIWDFAAQTSSHKRLFSYHQLYKNTVLRIVQCPPNIKPDGTLDYYCAAVLVDENAENLAKPEDLGGAFTPENSKNLGDAKTLTRAIGSIYWGGHFGATPQLKLYQHPLSESLHTDFSSLTSLLNLLELYR